MESAIRDNYFYGKVGLFLGEAIIPGSQLSIVSAYFTIYAYERLKNQLDQIDKLRFLFGEPSFINPPNLDPSKNKLQRNSVVGDKIEVAINNQLNQRRIAADCYKWLNEKAEIKSISRARFLHGKMYYIHVPGEEDMALMGSSNFTVSGLGLGQQPNMELNMVIRDEQERADLLTWFNDIWDNKQGLVEDVKEKVLKYLQKLFEDNSPDFIYYKTLYHLFDNFLAERGNETFFNEKTRFLDSQIWRILYTFQKDAVKGAINKILKYGGCIIADSVGLGKTFEALAVIKYFELLNKNVLVICPKKLSNNWTIYQKKKSSTLNPFPQDRFDYTVLYHTDLGRTGIAGADGIDLENFAWGNFDLVVIDESHNFRTNSVEKELEDGTKRMNRVKWLLEKIIKEGVDTKLLLLSATPVNNTLRDLRNQINLITKEDNSALYESTRITNISETLKLAQQQFSTWANPKLNPDRKVSDLMNRLGTDFTKLLDTLTIARSRSHVINFYGRENVGRFPGRLPAKPLYPRLDTEDRFLSYDSLNKKILQYKLSLFNPSKYVNIQHRAKYEALAGKEIQGFKQADREHYLINMMKINFLKRLESSVESFQVSMDRTIKKVENLIGLIKQYQQKFPVKGQLDLFAMEPEEDEKEDMADDEEQWQVGKKLKFDLADLALDKWLSDLEQDKEALVDLYNVASAINPDRDAKLKLLKETIQQKIEHPINEGNKKVLVFTAFADTAHYLFQYLKSWVQNKLGLNIAIVAGSFVETTYGKADFNHILTHFSPKSKNREKMQQIIKDDEIDILIATDCISEGQNLQDCDLLINYDIHWNPVRIIQRFGRIDRLGSTNEQIQLINFWPTADLDGYLNLKERVEARMALVDVTATGEDNLLNPQQLEDLITDDLKYRSRQLKRLQNEVLDLDELQEGGVSLTDFTLDDYRVDLWNFIQQNRDRLEASPLGLYAVVPAPGGKYSDPERVNLFNQQWVDNIKPGIIYCLRQQEEVEGGSTINPLFPYFLAYVRDDGMVKYSYVQSKQVLEMMRVLCQNWVAPYEALCKIFHEETENGSNMQMPDALLKAVITETNRLFKKKNLSQLTTGGRSAVLVPQQKMQDSPYQFELVTWIVIK